jgi:hypothetical protein
VLSNIGTPNDKYSDYHLIGVQPDYIITFGG